MPSEWSIFSKLSGQLSPMKLTKRPNWSQNTWETATSLCGGINYSKKPKNETLKQLPKTAMTQRCRRESLAACGWPCRDPRVSKPVKKKSKTCEIPESSKKCYRPSTTWRKSNKCVRKPFTSSLSDSATEFLPTLFTESALMLTKLPWILKQPIISHHGPKVRCLKLCENISYGRPRKIIISA